MSSLPGRIGTLTAHDVMTPNVIVLDVEESIQSAIQKLRSHHITGAPVVNAEGRLVGILSLSDLVGTDYGPTFPSALAHGNDRTSWDLFEKSQPLASEVAEFNVASRMSPKVTSVIEETPLVEVARAMCDGHWHRIPVVNRLGKLTGIVSTMDLLAAIVNVADEYHAEGELI